MNSLRFGVNYSPSKKWFFSWQDWEESSIREDLQAIQALGMDHIRAHLLWPVFQPNSNYVCETALDRLSSLLDIADSCGLDVQVTVLTGWICGYINSPAWQQDRNMFTDPWMMESEKRLFAKLAERIGGHPRFMGFDLGNELCVLGHGFNPFSVEQGDCWQNEMLAYCEKVAPGKFHVNGVDHNPWFHDFCFSRNALANTGSATSIHAWILFTGAMELYGPMETGCVRLAEYSIELANAYARDLSRPVWLEEFGINKNWMPEAQMAEFAERTIRSAATCSNLWGMTWWCSHDVDERYVGMDPLEYGMGLLDINNGVKPVGKRISELIREFRNHPVQPMAKRTALVLPDDLFSNPETPQKPYPGWHFARRYMEMAQEGLSPAVVLSTKIGDQAYLATRGISELLRM